jgi:serine/threonine protein kinase
MAKRRLDEFELGQPIGVGTVGTIYRAREIESGRDVALKILLPSVSSEPLIMARFEREMVILAKLSHPNIVEYFGGGRSEGQLFFAMELMSGGSIKDELSSGGVFSVLEAVACGIQIASALQHAHNHGVIHRDLKPSNLLFDESGTVKLVDFGVARDTFSADITADGLTVGSHAYMAPEQIHGKREITGHVDLYSFGCLFYELLVGQPPFLGDNFAQLFDQHLNAPPPLLRQSVPQAPDKLEELVQQMLAKAPEDRPFSARAVQGILLQMTNRTTDDLQPQRDVPAAAVVDLGRQALADRLRRRERRLSWYAVTGLFALAAAAAWIAWFLNP